MTLLHVFGQYQSQSDAVQGGLFIGAKFDKLLRD